MKPYRLITKPHRSGRKISANASVLDEDERYSMPVHAKLDLQDTFVSLTRSRDVIRTELYIQAAVYFLQPT